MALAGVIFNMGIHVVRDDDELHGVYCGIET